MEIEIGKNLMNVLLTIVCILPFCFLIYLILIKE
jgi:hypothetical protein